MEANRLGLPAYGGDLNPVPVLITKSTCEIPSYFADLAPVNPVDRTSEKAHLMTWKGAQGLAKDIRYYGDWMKDTAWNRIGYLYSKVSINNKDTKEATVVAWLWARTVRSPDPAWNGYVPLIKSGILRKKKNKPLVWVDPIVDHDNQSIIYQIREGGLPKGGTVNKCIATGASIDFKYLRQQGAQGLIEESLIGRVAKQGTGCIYIDPLEIASVPDPIWKPEYPLPLKALGFRVQKYGMKQWSDLFNNRQLVALSVFSDLLSDVWRMAKEDALKAGLYNDNIRLKDGGSGATAYADAIKTYLAFVIDRCAGLWSSLCIWINSLEAIAQVFGRQALSMVWDYAEANPFSSSSGSWSGQVNWLTKSVSNLYVTPQIGDIKQSDALVRLDEVESPLICTDPPYYDNVPYADLSDFFYVWLRHNLSDIWPNECATVLTPKKRELIADPNRAGSKEAAQQHFEQGMAQFMNKLSTVHNSNYPATIFYAFKANEIKDGNTISTGWATFLQGLINANLQITATWPLRTERPGRLRAYKSAALASSIVIACRPRHDKASTETRGGFISILRTELPEAIHILQNQNIAPADMAQSAIGPGMKVFSKFKRVVEADGSTMQVRTALALINEVLGEVLSEEEAELDADSQFALTWFEQYGYKPGPYGTADVLARAKLTAVNGVVEAGIAVSRDGNVRLLRREELNPNWSPMEDKRSTDWEAVQHLIRLLHRSENEAASLLKQLGGEVSHARQLAYLLYSVCEKKKWSKEAVTYNSLINVWPELVRLSSTTRAGQQTIV